MREKEYDDEEEKRLFGAELREFREARGLSPVEMAEAMGLAGGRGTYVQYELGNRKMNYALLHKLYDLGCNITRAITRIGPIEQYQIADNATERAISDTLKVIWRGHQHKEGAPDFAEVNAAFLSAFRQLCELYTGKKKISGPVEMMEAHDKALKAVIDILK